MVLGVVGCTNTWPLEVVLFAVACICAVELSAMFFNGPNALQAITGATALLVGVPELARWNRTPVEVYGLLILFLLSLVACGLLTRRPSQWGWLFLAGFWFGVPLLLLRSLHPGTGATEWGWHLPNAVLIVLLPIWAGDTAAMLGGKAFGKHKLAPTISPSKTWEGAISNFAACVLAAWGVGAWLGYELWVGLACGAAIGVFGQIGDLFESLLKRAAGKKDSGTILPGHGGVLDRIDALLGAAVPVWLILWLSGSI